MASEQAIAILDWYLADFTDERPGADTPWAFFNAAPLPGLLGEKNGLLCEQRSRMRHDALLTAGYQVSPRAVSGAPLDGGLFLATRNRRQNEATIARLSRRLKPGAPLLIAGAKSNGIDSLAKWLSRRGAEVERHSKFHAKLVSLRVNDALKETFAKDDVDDRMLGHFNKGEIDSGSALLIETFDRTVSGRTADFCSGTGHLASAILSHGAPESVDLYEDDHAALECSKAAVVDHKIPVRFHWTDLARQVPDERFDWIVMNPPFHQGRAAEPELGQQIIRTAARCLDRGGRLRMVANQNLPYEKTLSECFGGWEKVLERGGFKVLEARR